MIFPSDERLDVFLRVERLEIVDALAEADVLHRHAQLLRNDCVELGMDLSCALDVPGGRTSTYLYITDERGEMQLGLCDTDISAAITPDYLQRHLDVLDGAAAVVLDGNLTAETITWLGAHCSAPLFADPVSITKAERMRASLLSLIHI